ncbi:carboxypeptidase regulatory-like domain-containing protein [Marinobacter sp. chi1]|uniref:Carboxypeptidase regulatory-like domain-containing protein n=1 Tax=Marinobacter suaedae TaxID=3057675 RepID=A0ABT8VW98_9GAMM|nr:carboxypeptidase regulatory-like domain-containing protein [Marinobacter sp. chi1]MDO3720261.1 carboxypeptidase regulatory-like domain-containing protein [Marinobacter sp. chi1]
MTTRTSLAGLRVATLSTAVLAASSASAAVITGKLTNNEGEAIAGAIVRLSDVQNGLSESVYTGADGGYVLETDLKGELRLRFRAHYFEDFEEQVVLGSADSALEKNIRMVALETDRQISESLAASYHFNELPFDTEEDQPFTREKFQLECLSCHQLGNPFTRTVRPAESWRQTVQRMHAYMGAVGITEKDKRRAEIFAEGFDGKPTDMRPEFPFDPALTHTKVYEYQLPSSGVPHDAYVHSDNGLVYTVDQFADGMYVTDLDTKETRFVPHPEQDMPLGGIFTVLGVPPAMNKVNVRHGPHSLAEGPDGKLYTTNSYSASIGVFNAETNQWEEKIPLPGNAPYPHTIRVDKEGILWFSVVGTEQIGRLDPKTQEVTLITLPEPRPVAITPAVLTYGVAVSSLDGSIWYSRLWGNRIGRIDPETLEVTEIESPVFGPRRLRFAEDGILWQTGYGHGEIARIDTRTMDIKVYEMPEFSPDARPGPYSLNIAPSTGDVWINETMTDHIYRFDPKAEEFVAYPAPLRGTYTRDVTFTDEGWACMTNNPIPVQALEEFTGVLMCLDPNYRN